jgi:hypothetical protein
MSLLAHHVSVNLVRRAFVREGTEGSRIFCTAPLKTRRDLVISLVPLNHAQSGFATPSSKTSKARNVVRSASESRRGDPRAQTLLLTYVRGRGPARTRPRNGRTT